MIYLTKPSNATHFFRDMTNSIKSPTNILKMKLTKTRLSSFMSSP